MKELILGPIVGGLSPDRAYLWGRANGPAKLYAWLSRQPDLSEAVLAGVSLPLSADNAFAGVAVLHELHPQTRYYYALSLDEQPPPPGKHPHFTTFPLPGELKSFSFVFGSCFRPADQNGGQTFSAIEAMRRAAEDEPARALRFMLHIGDQIYADAYAHNGIGKIACSLEEYRAVYAYTWSRPPLQHLMANLPAFMTLDDHEVDDDWRWTDNTRQNANIPWWDKVSRRLKGFALDERRLPLQRVQNALQAYWEHQGMHAPGFELPPEVNAAGQYELRPQDPGSLAYSFMYGAAAFFVLDTRSMRVRGPGERSMLGEGQWQALEDWLNAVKDAYPVKFIVTSCALLYRLFLDIPQDRWSGFPLERNRLLGLLAEKGIENVYLLAGDLHAAHAVRAELYGPHGRSLPLWEFCSTPFEQKPSRSSPFLYNPFPFWPGKETGAALRF